MNNVKKSLLALVAIGFIGCAQKAVVAEVEQRVAQQPTRSFHGEVAFKGIEAIESSDNLSQNQKMQLRELSARMQRETFQIQNEMSRLKAVLFEMLVEKPFPRAHISVVKEKLQKLNDKKMLSMFQALDDFEKIIGESKEKEKLYKDYWQMSL